MQTYDLIGVGFGPSNIALAISLDEDHGAGKPMSALFVEKQARFAWHRDMMLDHAHMQVSFMKDLATLRNPRSRFTFINYLHETGRLPDFINLKTFFPSRREFNDYLGWAARHFEHRCAYGEEVFDVLPETQGGRVELLRILSRDHAGAVHSRLARNLVVSIGGTASIPSPFAGLRGNPRVFHSSTYLRGVEAHAHAKRIAVIGAGQSAAEIFMDLHGRPNAPKVDLIMRGRAMRPSDDSPFVNEIFNAEFTDYIFGQPDGARAAILEEFRHTNYAVPDLALIQQIFKVFYEQRVAATGRHRFLRRQEIVSATAADDGIDLTLRGLDKSPSTTTRYDAVILATGYVRDGHKALLSKLAPFLGDLSVDRQYQVRSATSFAPRVFLQGACEASHGLSDTLLSVTALRTMEIAETLGAAPVVSASARPHEAELPLPSA